MLHPAAEQLDERVDVADPVGGVVEDDVEVVSVRPEHLGERARDGAVDVQPAGALGHLGQVAVGHGHLVALLRQLEEQSHADVPVAAENEDAHGADPTHRDARRGRRCSL